MTDTAKILCTAKVVCTAKSEAGDDHQRLGFSPDYAEGANAEWAKATPSLSLSTVMLNQVAERFEVGTHITLLYTVDEIDAGSRPGTEQ